MKEQKSVRAKEFSSRYVKIYVAAAILCLLTAVAISFTVLKLTSDNGPVIPPVVQPTLTPSGTTAQPTVTPSGSATPTIPQTPPPSTDLDPSKIETVVMTEAQMKYGSLVLVNKQYSFDPETAVTELVTIREQPDRTITVNAWGDRVTYATFKALCSLQTAMESEIDGKNMQLCTTEPYFNNDPNSEHATGLCANLKFQVRNGAPYNFGAPEVKEQYVWLTENAYRFGLVFRYRAEKQTATNHSSEISHLRYVGAVHAEYMYKYNLCLEEYLEALKSYNFNNPLTFESSDGNSYYIYHVTATEGGDTTIPIRKDSDSQTFGEYTISGTNCGGFIVLQPFTNK